MLPYERGSVSTVVCHLFVVRVPKRSAVCSQALCVVSGEASANFEQPSRSHFSDSCQQTILVELITRPLQRFKVRFSFKIGHKLTSNEARKVGLVSVVSFGAVSGEALAKFERPSRSTCNFLAGFSPANHPRLANEKGFARVFCFFKSDTN